MVCNPATCCKQEKFHWAKVLWLRFIETIRGESFAVELKHSYIVHCKLLI